MAELRARRAPPAAAAALAVALAWVGWIGIGLCVALLLLVECAFPSGRPASDA